MPIEAPVSSCETCPCGKAAGVGSGGRCPLVARARPRGSYLYLEGDAAARVWFVKRGCVVLARAQTGGESDAPHRLRRAGSLVGMEAMVRETYLDSARLTVDSVLCSASRETMDAWLKHANPLRTVLELMLHADCGDSPRLCRSDGSAAQRVARWLLTESSRAGQAQVARRTIAGLLGMVPETLSRALTRLAQLGAIDVTRTTLYVRDPELLRAVASRDLDD